MKVGYLRHRTRRTSPAMNPDLMHNVVPELRGDFGLSGNFKDSSLQVA